MGLHPSSTKSRETNACPRPSGTWNQAGGTSSIRYEVARKEGLSSSVRYVESSRWDYVCLVYKHANGQLVLVRPVRGLNQAGLRTSGTKSHERRASPCPSGTWNIAGVISSVWFEVSQKVCLSSSFRYKESSKWDFVRLVQSHAKGEHVLVRLVQGITLARLRPSGMKSRKMKAYPLPSDTRNQAGGTPFVRYEVARKEGMS